MQRIAALDVTNAPEASKPMLEELAGKLGRVPNIFATVANSPTALKALLGFFRTMKGGALAGVPHEAIALRVGQMNGCRYCTAAHTAAAKAAGVSVEDTLAFRRGEAGDARIQAIVDLAGAINEKRGAIDDAELAAAREAGLSDDEIMETLAAVVQNIFTNTVNALAQTEVDFPAAPELA